ncbi:hypothetical protein ACFQZV_12870 [Microbacterium koreense]|uniref:Phage holin family protein n=1 Tax=Microbacterium koreense TaxID=323761 RepID=A0ABW2ZUQ3_9MICO
MKAWVVRFASLLVFNVVVLLLIGWLTPARVGWSALWAGIVLTALVLWVKPLVAKMFRGLAEPKSRPRGKFMEWLVGLAVTAGVAVVVWVVTVLLSGVQVGNWFWGYILPPLILMIGWGVYSLIDDKLETQAGAIYDKATGKDAAPVAAPETTSPAPSKDHYDGLTAEQRRMLDDLRT